MLMLLSGLDTLIFYTHSAYAVHPGHSSIVLMAFSPQNAPQERFALREGSK